jgi:hypothetical protein
LLQTSGPTWSDRGFMGRRQRFAWAVLAAMAAVSVVGGLRNAATLNLDFQWSAARVLLEGADPFLLEQLGDPSGRLSSGAVHAHLLYVLYLPLAILDVDTARGVWSVINIMLATIAVIVLGRALSLERGETLVLGLLLLSSTPLRVAVGNSQMSLVVLACVAMLLHSRSSTSTVVAGGSAVKWSFTPVIFLWVLMRRGWRAAALLVVAPLAGFLVFAALVGDLSLTALLRPALGQSQGVSAGLGYADLMSILRRVDAAQWLIIGAPLVATVIGGLWGARTIASDGLSLAAVLTVSLATVNHLNYDLVLLAPALASAIALRHLTAARWILAICGYLLFNDLPLKSVQLLAAVQSRMNGSEPTGGRLQSLSTLLAEPALATSPVTVAFHMVLLVVVLALLLRLDRTRSRDLAW